MAHTRLYRDGVLRDSDFPITEAAEHLRDPAAVVWLDLCEPTEADLAMISDELDLHRLAVEDAVGEHQRPKLERYGSHSFLTTYATRLDPESGELTTSELSAFLTDRALVTVRENDEISAEEICARWDDEPELSSGGVGFLLHGVLDYIVDLQLDAVQALDEQIEELEDLVFDERAGYADAQRRWLRLRKSVARLRRVLLPMREALTTLMRREHHTIDDELLPFFQDVHDHVVHAAEWSESLREHVTTIREAQLGVQGNRLNTIMKQLTGWAAIIAVPTAITGYFGQNLPFPGFQQASGFWLSTVSILLLSLGLFAVFKRRDWL